MSKKNGRVHFNVLLNSTRDTIELGRAVEVRFVEVCNAYLRIRGETLVPPVELAAAMLRWREMRVRHKSRDLRNTSDELRATKLIAQWTVDVNCVLRNQKPAKIVWGL